MDFESRLFVKPNAAQLLHAALSRPGYECRPIAMGTNTDPYQPIEERWRITRSVIELLLETRHPFTITTKSDRVLRDLDLLKPAADLGIASVAMSVTSLDPKIARTLEPRAPQPRKRLAAVKALNDAGVPCYVAIAPVVPQITDHELEHIVEAAVEAGAPGGFYLPVRLPHEVAPLVPRLARRALSRPRGQGDGDDPLDARRPRQRSQFLQPDARPGPVGRAAHAPGSRSRPRNTACARPNSRFAPTCSVRPKATRCGCFDRSGVEFNRPEPVTNRPSLLRPSAMKPYLLAALLLSAAARARPDLDHHAFRRPSSTTRRSPRCATMRSITTIMPGTSSKG